ncbi:MAG: ATP-binding protein [Candidatus Aureabacteria bacterium]|nr:ATP-binding protein [Candidatus Auribacterota bacterium]
MKQKEITILVVEDNPADLRLVAEMLKESARDCFRIVHADRLEHALHLLSQDRVDAIVLDINLPDSHGLNGLERISEQEPHIPVIVLTGLSDEEIGIEAMQRGAENYLVKGMVDTDLLVRSIRYAIERKLIKAALAASEEKFRNLFEGSNDAIIVSGLTAGMLADCNKMVEALLGYSKGELLSMSVSDLVTEEKREEVVLRYGTLQNVKNIRMEMELLSKDKKIIPVEASMSVIKIGENTFVQSILRDISLQKRSEAILHRDRETLARMVEEQAHELVEAQVKLERSKRLSDIGTLAATVAHELRNPLAAMRLSVSNLELKVKEAVLKKHLQNIDKKIVESDQIIGDLLYYARIRMPEHETICLDDIIDECIEVAQKLSKKKLSVKKKFASLENNFLDADPRQIKEVFQNILNNAYDAVPDRKGAIEIEARDDTGFIQVGFKDNGAGIDKHNLDKVFDPFFTTKTNGTGLGLSVCREIVDLHGGAIRIESQPGKGTTVTVSLPKRRSRQ